MAEENAKKTKTPKSPLIGAEAKPAVLDSTTKLDIDTNKVLLDNIIEAGLTSKLDIGELERFTTISNSRDQVYQLIDTMCQDSTVSSIVRTYAEDVCETGDNGHIIWCESQDPKISMFVNYLLNTMNVDKNIFGWTYSLIKYGDVYLKLYRESDYDDKLFKKDNIDKVDPWKTKLNEDVNISLHAGSDKYSYYVEMVADPSTMFELTKYGKTYGYIEVPNNVNTMDFTNYIGGTAMLDGATQNFSYGFKSGDVNVYQADDFVHACLEDNVSRFPETVNLFYNLDTDKYSSDKKKHKTKNPNSDTTAGSQNYSVRRGKSLLYDAYKIWREKALLEAAALLSRITKSGVVRKVSVEVGDMPKEQVQLTLRRVKEMFEQKTSYNTGKGMSEYTNPGAVENFIYHATHNGQGAITVESVGGDYDPKQLTDLDWWNNKFFSSFGIPKQFFGWTDDATGFNGGTSLTIISSVYSKGVKRIQNTILQAITDAINLILLNKGLKAYLNNFTLRMKAPLSQEEIDYRSNLTERINAISNANALFTDVEDKPRRLEILKALVNTLHLGDDIIQALDAEAEAAKETAKEEKAKAEEEANANAEAEAGGEEEAPEELGGEDELDLAPMPDEEIKEEGFTNNGGSTVLTEDQDLFEDDDLPTPEEVNSDIDFTENK